MGAQVSNIGPGSPILYIVYSTIGDAACITEAEHSAIFQAAVSCLA